MSSFSLLENISWIFIFLVKSFKLVLMFCLGWDTGVNLGPLVNRET